MVQLGLHKVGVGHVLGAVGKAGGRPRCTGAASPRSTGPSCQGLGGGVVLQDASICPMAMAPSWGESRTRGSPFWPPGGRWHSAFRASWAGSRAGPGQVSLPGLVGCLRTLSTMAWAIGPSRACCLRRRWAQHGGQLRVAQVHAPACVAMAFVEAPATGSFRGGRRPTGCSAALTLKPPSASDGRAGTAVWPGRAAVLLVRQLQHAHRVPGTPAAAHHAVVERPWAYPSAPGRVFIGGRGRGLARSS